jgi:hypothetical protein
MTIRLDPKQVARVLGGEAIGSQISAPGPGHSTRDRSLSVRLSIRPHHLVLWSTVMPVTIALSVKITFANGSAYQHGNLAMSKSGASNRAMSEYLTTMPSTGS